MRPIPLLALAALIPFVSCVTVRDESIKPGINDNFQDPDIQTYIGMFEGEDRAIYVNREAIVDVLELRPGMDVADVGAGTGFFTRMFAQSVGPEGTVYAVDIAEEFLEHIGQTSEEAGIDNIELVLCDQRSTKLPPNSVDVVFICDTYHHFEFPQNTLASIHNALRADGKLVVVDFERVKDVTAPFAWEHVRAGKGTFTDEIKNAGFDFVREPEIMKDQYVLVFTRRAAPPASAQAAGKDAEG